MIAYLWVAAGSALGGMARFGFGLVAARLWGESFPWGTIAINILGSFVIGFFGALTVADGAMPASASLRIFVMVGICGGFTTFSSFSLQTLSLARDGGWFAAMANVVLSVVLCLLAVTAGHVSAERIGLARAQAGAMPRRILAILDRPETAHPVLVASGLVAARSGGAAVTALHLRHGALDAFMPTEDVMTRQRREEIDGAAARKSAAMHDIFESWRAGSGAGEWREMAGEARRVIAAEAAGADLIVVGRCAGAPAGDAGQAVLAALFDLRLPTLLVPPAEPASLGRRIAIAWKPSGAADRAIEAAMPLLLRADAVSVLTEAGRVGQPDADAAQPLHRLRRAGVKASAACFERGGRSVGRALLDEAGDLGADLLVMGAYTHNRFSEMVLGGATREVLASADLPVLMRH